MQCTTYSFDCKHKAPVSEENKEDGNEEMDHKHVDDIGFIVEAWSQSVVVGSAGALHALREISVKELTYCIRLLRSNHLDQRLADDNLETICLELNALIVLLRSKSNACKVY